MAGGYLEVGSYDTVIALLSLLWLVTWGLVGSDGGGIFRSWIPPRALSVTYTLKSIINA